MPSEFDFQYAMENTRVLHEPDRRIDTFGSTEFEFQLVSELMDAVNVSRVRCGRIEAQKPLIVKPQNVDEWNFDGFGPQGEAFGQWVKDHLRNLAILKYAFQFKRTDIQEQVVHEPLGVVADRLLQDQKSSGNPLRAIIQGVDDTWEISLLRFTFEMVERSHEINKFDFKRRGFLG
jgi:hypothetical protein